MAEYIDRDMLIVEGWHMERLIRSMDAGVATITIETKKPADFPAADVVEVVRCKDCKHRDDNDMCFIHHDYGEFVYLDGYCNYAEEA